MNKLIALLLAGSLVLNATLLALIVVGKQSAPPPVAAGATAKPLRANTPAGPVIDGQVWPSLHGAGDLPALVANLRESGFPKSMVRAIVQAHVMELFAARRRALDPESDSRPFWKSTIDAKVTDAQRQLGREQQKMMRDLLGNDANPDDSYSRAREGRMFGHLPPEKADDARRIVREFNDLRNDLFMSMSGIGGSISITPAMSEKMAALDKQMNAELAKIMTAQEFADYELRGSNTANSLRQQLVAFEPTELEFRTLFQLQKAFDERFGRQFAPPSQEESRLRSEVHRQLTEQIKAALGPARAADYERATNYEYRQASQLVARLELPPETTKQLWDIRAETQRRAAELRSLPAAQRDEQLRALQTEASARISPILGGASRVESYKQYGGSWLNSLVPRPPPQPPAAPPRS